MDVLVNLARWRVGIEVDGPSHFIGTEPSGKTILKRHQVFNIDRLQILSVPYWEWDMLGNNHLKKQEYLLSKLEL